MSERLGHLTPIERTLLLTLCGRADDAASASPWLGDTVAAQVAGKIDEPVRAAAAGDADLSLNVAIRAATLDTHVRNFLATYPNGVVVDLGCGLETRVFRLDPPPGADFYGIDFPAVIEVRRRLVPEHQRETLIAGSLEDPQWLNDVPADRPSIIVADGVLTFLGPSEATELLKRLTDHFAHGELVCQANIKFLTRDLGRVPELKKVGIPPHYQGFGIDEPAELERINPKLRFVEEFILARNPDHFNRFSLKFRTILRLLRLRTKWARLSTWVVRYQF